MNSPEKYCSSLWQEDKPSFGYSPSPTWTGPFLNHSRPTSPGFEANRKLAMEQLDIDIGNCLWPSPPKSLFPKLLQSLADDRTAKLADRKRQLLMYGRKKLALKELNSSLVPGIDPICDQYLYAIGQFEEIRKLIGSLPGMLPNEETSEVFQPIFVCRVTGPFVPLRQIMKELLEEPLLAESFGAVLELGSHSLPGILREPKLILKIPGPSFGVVTMVKKMLSSMNSEEVSTSRTFLDGWIVTLAEWKLKDPIDHFVPNDFTSPVMLNPGTGTRTSTRRRSKPYYGD